MHAWNKRQAGSAFALALLLSTALLLISAATDEGGVAWATRISRIVPLLPVPALGAHVLTLHRAARRGETRALETVGIEPASWQIWVALAALLPSFAGAIALAAGLDTTGLFPSASTAKACAVDASAAGHAVFLCTQAGLRVQGTQVELLPTLVAHASASPRGLAAASAVVLTGFAIVMWAGAALRRPGYGLAAAALLLAETMVCQTVGANLVPAAAAVLLPALAVGALLADRIRKTAMARVSSTRAKT